MDNRFWDGIVFAIRSGCGCCVYSAEVPENRVVMRMHNRSEHEVLVRHKDLQNIRKENLETYDDMSEMVEEVNSVMFYFLDTLEYRKRAYKYMGEGIHGRSHMLRVLFYTILYCRKMDMDYDDVFILSLASIFHDIGRADDSENSTHGAKAVRIIRKDGLLEGLSENMKSVVEFIITYHCVSDGKIKFDGQDKEVELLKIFKDMDYLDRCRFCLYRNEFDIKYMRNKEAVEMLLKAGLLFSKKVDKFLGGIDDERQSDYS